jgi:hypothetical protein
MQYARAVCVKILDRGIDPGFDPKASLEILTHTGARDFNLRT